MEQLAHTRQLLFNDFKLSAIDIFQTPRQVQLRIELSERAERDADVVTIPASRSARVTLRDVRRNRDGRAPHLSTQAEFLRSWDPRANLISCKYKIHSRVPDVEISKADNLSHWRISLSATQRPSRLAESAM
jgi:hypothetical protein